jgi:hypothetical protein
MSRATVLQAGYPPFGLANVSFVGLSSLLILSGLYYSAISVAHDARLRQSIKKSAIEESKLLASIGAAQMEPVMAAVVGVATVVLPSVTSVSACTTRCWNDPSEQHRSDNSYVADSHYQGTPQGPP